jgi:WD40 repeat protein
VFNPPCIQIQEKVLIRINFLLAIKMSLITSSSRFFITLLLIFAGITFWTSQTGGLKLLCLFSDIDHSIVDDYNSEYTFGEEIIPLETGGHNGGVRDISFSPNGSLLASCDHEKILLLNIHTKESRILTYKTETSFTLEALTFSPDGTTLAVSEYDVDSLGCIHPYLRFFNIITGKETVFYTGNETQYIGVSLAFSPNGLKLAVGSYNYYGSEGGITIYNLLNGELISDPLSLKHKSQYKRVYSVDYSPDGSLLVSGHDDDDYSDNGTVKLWDLNEGKIIRVISNNSGTVKAVKFSPNGTFIAAAGLDSKVRLWDINGDLIWEETHLSSISITTLDFSPTGSLLITGDSLGNLKIWNIANSSAIFFIKEISGHIRTVSSLEFSPDGSILASASKDNKIKFWNMIQRVEKVEIPASPPIGDLKTSAMSLDGLKIATGDSDGNIYFRNLANKKFDSRTRTINGSITSIVFSPNSPLLVTAGESESLIIWNITQDQFNHVKTLSEEKGRVFSVTFSPDGSMLASSSDSMIRIWNTTNWRLIKNCTAHAGEIYSVKFSSSGDLLASGGMCEKKGVVMLWDTTVWSNTTKVDWHSEFGSYPRSLAFSPDGLLLAAGGRENADNKKIRVWDVANGIFVEKEFSPLTSQTGEISCVDFSIDSKVLASGSYDGTIIFWDTSTGDPLYSFPRELSAITSLTFSSNNYDFASASDDIVTIWNLDSIPSDYDGDGMPDDWESEYELNILDWEDKFHDSDNDGLINSLERFLDTKPNDTDTDKDNMPDAWEYFNNLAPTLDDAHSDKDEDGMSNYYEYSWNLHPLYDDSSEDYDNDTLTNLEEYLNGELNPYSSDTDNDSMPDGWEVQMGLDPTDWHDNTSDADNDDMENWWECEYGFNASNPDDARQDFDGDCVRNVDEFRGGSNPKDFWDVPILSLSAVHLLLGLSVCIILGISFITMKCFLLFREKQRIALINQLGAPDYITTKKIQHLNLKNYAELEVEVDKAKDTIAEGTLARTRGQLPLAVQLYEQALKQYSAYLDDPLVAETVFNTVWIQKDLGVLPQIESLMKYFPQPPHSDLAVKPFHNMLEAVIAEEEKNWGLATRAWQAALAYTDLEIKYRAICQGSLVNLEFRDWLTNPIPPDYEKLISQVEEWRKFCEDNNLNVTLCWAYLTHARIALAVMQFDEAGNLFSDCMKTAEENQIIYYQELVRKETEVFEKHKNKIYALTREGEPISPSIQSQLVQEYLLKAKAIVKEEDQMREQIPES